MASRESASNPFLQGNFAPWRLEGEALDLEVTGDLPRDLNGTFYRNGPNPAFEPTGRYHWFDGDGMIHAIRLEDGRASYRNRWVRSAGLLRERAAGRALYPGIFEMKPSEQPDFKNTANTNVVWHAGKLLALMEAALPTQLRPDTLETLGEYDFGGRLGGAMTAHPKIDPETGEMLFFGYGPFPYLQYYVADRAGSLVEHEVIDLPWGSMLHDFAVTAGHVVFILNPLVFSFEDLARRRSPYTWEPERGTRLGVMPRRGGAAQVRWYDAEACYVFHPLNAYEEDGRIVLDVARFARLDFMTPPEAREPARVDDEAGARLHRWTIDLAGGGVRSQQLDDVAVEFPRADERRLGRKHRWGYLAAVGPEGAGDMPLFTAIRRYDLERGAVEQRAFGAGNGSGEPLFVPRRPDAAEDDGYVLALVYDGTRNASDFHVLDARRIAGEPIATVRLPHRVPYGFHGNWVPAV